MSDLAWIERAEAELRRRVRAGGLPDSLAEELLDQVAPIVGEPNDRRAWGRVIQLLAGEGALKHVGYRRARSSNGSPKPVWRAM